MIFCHMGRSHLFTHSSISVCLGCFCLLVDVNNDVVNMSVQIPLWRSCAESFFSDLVSYLSSVVPERSSRTYLKARVLALDWPSGQLIHPPLPLVNVTGKTKTQVWQAKEPRLAETGLHWFFPRHLASACWTLMFWGLLSLCLWALPLPYKPISYKELNSTAVLVSFQPKHSAVCVSD